MTMGLIALALGALATIVAVPLMLNFLPFDATKAVVLRYLPWSVMFLVVLLVLGLFYRWAPNTHGKRQRWITPGSFLAALFWAAASMAFSVYLANFGSYNRIYGSIGAVIALLMWIYISVYIVLLGAVINAERDRMRDQ
jgi:membrane protein